MNIGKKIKILRNNLNLTGKQLSEITGINHGLIRKYETTDCTPQYSHILTISKALNVRPYVLTENVSDLKLETLGDLYSIIILLYKIGFLMLNIDKNDEISFCYNENIPKMITEKEDIFKLWINCLSNLNSFIDSVSNLNNPIVIDTINNYKEKIEILELELQQSVERLPPINANNKKKEDLLIEKLSTLVNKNNPYWKGTATELAEILGLEIKSNILSRKLNNISDELYEKHNICYKRYRTSEYRGIELTFIKK